MVIDLNKYVKKPFINREVLLENINDYAIYSYYIGSSELHLNKAISSPLREDPTPSFGFYKNKEGKILYNDFVKGGGDCFMFVKQKFGYLRWFDVFSRIAIDFNLNTKYLCNENLVSDTPNKKILYDNDIIIKSKEKCIINVSTREWQKHDYQYWNQFSIDSQMLSLYNVLPVKYIFLNNKPIAADKHAYVYIETKDGFKTYKIYQPYSKYKWFTNNDNSVWQGWTQLPAFGEKLIITKSLKDVMSIREITGLNCIALQNEKAIPKDVIIEDLKSRFDNIYVLFDNDYDKQENWGQINAKRICRDHMLKNIVIEREYKSKDFSDLVKNHSMHLAKSVLNLKIK
tara:strand:- start:82095 stop:83123 length:1029 start_codon:yes stop_codon:yes gene_type:complete